MVESSLLAVGLDLRCETAGLPGVDECCVAVTGGGVGGGEVDEEAAAGTDKFIWQMGEGGGQLVDCVGCADASQGITAPAVKVCVAEEQKRQGGVDGIGRE